MVGLIGAEPYINGVGGLLAEIDRLKLDNIRVVPDDARPVLAALPEASFERIFVLFPDPWPKRRHHRRRLVAPANLDQFARLLRDGAELRLATDDRAYLAWMLEHLLRHPAFEWLARRPSDWRVRPPDWPVTRYEEKARRAGRAPVFLRFHRRPRAG